MGARKKKKTTKSISTKKGDKGKTSLLDGSRTSKGSMRPEAYGTLDEAQSFIGLARSKTALSTVQAVLLEVQNNIYVINSELACPPESRHLLKRTIGKKDVEALTDRAREIEESLKLPPKFIIYGELETAALLDVARAVVRRAERAVSRLEGADELENTDIRAYINRLSDLLFLLARLEEREAGVVPRHPE
jgi:cob(I)alamin adenosyltransferase